MLHPAMPMVSGNPTWMLPQAGRCAYRRGPYERPQPANMAVRPTLGHRAGGPYGGLVRPHSVISVITAVHAATVGHLSAAYSSLASQFLPAGWDWEWLVQEDGLTGLLHGSPLTAADPRIRPAAGPTGGPGVARTLALARA